METKENITPEVNKITETLSKELESMTSEGLRDFFVLVYKLNHQHFNTITPDQFEEFLATFEHNPFKLNEDKAFRKQLIDNVIKYSCDHMSLLTAAVLIKKKFTTEEIIENYYSNVNVFDNEWF